jgi:hypothetical protein
MKLRRSLLLVLLWLPLVAVAQQTATLTLVEGPLRLIRGATVLQGTRGVRVQPGDIIESADAGFVQVEFTGGAVVALGGTTRILILGRVAGRNAGSSTELLLLSGWLKSQAPSKAGVYRCDSPLLGATIEDGSLVLHSTAAAAEMFVESGSAHIGEVSSDGNWRDPRIAKAGQFFSRPAGKNVAVSARPSSTFVEAMPRQFRDTLASLASRFTGKPPEPKRDHEVTYSEIQPWLTSPLAWRKGFVRRFQARLQDSSFRRPLDAHLRDYPEWGPVLHPSDHPKTSPTALANPDPQSSNPQSSGRNSK